MSFIAESQPWRQQQDSEYHKVTKLAGSVHFPHRNDERDEYHTAREEMLCVGSGLSLHRKSAAVRDRGSALMFLPS